MEAEGSPADSNHLSKDLVLAFDDRAGSLARLVKLVFVVNDGCGLIRECGAQRNSKTPIEVPGRKMRDGHPPQTLSRLVKRCQLLPLSSGHAQSRQSTIA